MTTTTDTPATIDPATRREAVAAWQRVVDGTSADPAADAHAAWLIAGADPRTRDSLMYVAMGTEAAAAALRAQTESTVAHAVAAVGAVYVDPASRDAHAHAAPHLHTAMATLGADVTPEACAAARALHETRAFLLWLGDDNDGAMDAVVMAGPGNLAVLVASLVQLGLRPTDLAKLGVKLG